MTPVVIGMREWSLARQLVVLQIGVVVLTVGIEAMVGVYQGSNPTTLNHRLLGLVTLTEVALTVGIGGSLLVADRVHRQTFGLEPAEIARQYQHHDAMLHAVSEGLLITDQAGRLVLANDEARRLLGLPPEGAEGVPLAELDGVTGSALLAGSEPLRNQVCVTADRVLLVSRNPVERGGRPIGAVMTLRDRTELQAALRELGTIRAFAESLRAQTHESANRLQALVGLVELGRYEEAVALGTRDASLAQQLSDQLIDRIGEPALVALLLGKSTLAAERGVRLRISDDTRVGAPRWLAEDLLTVVGNLLDNAVDSAAGNGSGWVELSLREDAAGGLRLRVRDSGPGLPAGHHEDIFMAGWSTKPATGAGGRGIGLALVAQLVRRLGGTVVAADAEDGPGAVFEVRLPELRTEPGS
jgi:two-component system CitB family sensor kinase